MKSEIPTLLIVDDEKTTRDGLRAALEDRYDVYLAEDASAAMELLEAEHFARVVRRNNSCTPNGKQSDHTGN